MIIKRGDTFRHRLTGHLYRVKMVKGGAVILQSEGSPNRLWFGTEGVKLFFEAMQRRELMQKVCWLEKGGLGKYPIPLPGGI
jgi:hypothetical protein